MTISDDLYATRLTINLDDVAWNYRLLQGMLDAAGTRAGAAVKADGYGIGARPVVRALWQAGCRDFFVAHPAEGLAVLEELSKARVHVLNGLIPEAAAEYPRLGLIPVLNDLGQIAAWRELAKKTGRPLAADVHLDTGMCRLGLDRMETEKLLTDPTRCLAGIEVGLVISHLASADEPASNQSERQLAMFKRIRAHLSMGKASLANSSGIFLGSNYHFDVARPGVALYGGNP